MNYKVIGTDQREYGPISAEQVRQWIGERRLNSMSLGQAEDTKEWKPLTAFPDFLAALQSVAPPASPAPLPSAPSGTRRTNSMAVLGLVMGIITITCGGCCCYGFPFNILGVIFSALALSQINSNPQTEQGKGMAIAGLVLSILGTVLVILFAMLAMLLAGLGQTPRSFHFRV